MFKFPFSVSNFLWYIYQGHFDQIGYISESIGDRNRKVGIKDDNDDF